MGMCSGVEAQHPPVAVLDPAVLDAGQLVAQRHRELRRLGAFMDDLEAKIRLYQSFHDDTDAWVTLDKGAAPGDAVYPVPLSALP